MPDRLRTTPVGDPEARVAALLGGGSLGRAVAAAAAAASPVLEEATAGRRLAPARIEELARGFAAETHSEPEEANALLYIAAVREPRLLSLPPDVAMAAVVDLFCTLGPAEEASLWWRPPHGSLTVVARTGDTATTKAFKAAAAAALAGTGASDSPRRSVRALPVASRAAALVYRCRAPLADRCRAYALEAAACLDVLFLVDDLLRRNADRERSLVESSERRLVRVGFDLHDGPMQDIAALAQDVRLFRAQLGTILEDNGHRQIALGRVDDLEARLLELDRNLREVAASLHSPTVLRLPFVDVLEQDVGSYDEDAGVTFSLSTSGDLDELTSTQKIALLRVIQESLANVREHAGAHEVSVHVHGGSTEITAEIRDDGRGFDVTHRLPEAARAGRLGLVGMGERIRLLGGRFDVESSRGGPTCVRASIPRWRPLGDAVAESVATA